MSASCPKNGSVERAALFPGEELDSGPIKLNSVASLEQFFDLTNGETPVAKKHNTSPIDAINLFSTSTNPTKVSLEESTYEVPLINRKRPREYYFTDP
jgi:hypothetical protein